jgi:hypothetical protein
MSVGHSRCKALTLAAGVMVVLIVAFVVAPVPWPKPWIGVPTPPMTGDMPTEDAESELERDPLLQDLEDGRWKAGDSVEAVIQ